MIEEICSSAASETETARTTAQFAQSSPLSIIPTHHKDDVASESFSAETVSLPLQGYPYSRTRGYDSLDVKGSQPPRSPANRSSGLFPETGQVVNGIRRLSNSAQSPRFVLRLSNRLRVIDLYIRSSLADFTVNEQDSETFENSPLRPRTHSFSAVLPGRLTRPQRVETALQQHDDSRPHDAPIATSPRTNSCLSPISPFLLLETFSRSADSTPAIGSPKKQARSIEHAIKRNHQDVESEVDPNRLTFVSSSFNHSSLNRLVVMPSHPAQSGYLHR